MSHLLQIPQLDKLHIDASVNDSDISAFRQITARESSLQVMVSNLICPSKLVRTGLTPQGHEWPTQMYAMVLC